MSLRLDFVFVKLQFTANAQRGTWEEVPTPAENHRHRKRLQVTLHVPVWRAGGRKRKTQIRSESSSSQTKINVCETRNPIEIIYPMKTMLFFFKPMCRSRTKTIGIFSINASTNLIPAKGELFNSAKKNCREKIKLWFGNDQNASLSATGVHSAK